MWEDGGHEDRAIAALLHDAIEDAGQSHASIAERFGVDVADIVRDCTDTSPEAQPGEKEPWLLRKTRYLDSLAGKPLASRSPSRKPLSRAPGGSRGRHPQQQRLSAADSSGIHHRELGQHLSPTPWQHFALTLP